ncbi:MAG: FKBP-type peptidyl-prolyl cis-trans isomerase [Magnetococcales bacterium]|nr:FKBP-type peptidyl-prolyl cis-trans isomerase [Magnetococcales bacterium]
MHKGAPMRIRTTRFQGFLLALGLLVGTMPGCSEEKPMTTGESRMFLEENAKKEGVTVTESGLQYEVLTQGDGPKPASRDTVRVHYAGTLVDGTEFDSSYKRGEPISFPLNRVIKGWTEGLQLMPVGSKYRLTIPGDLAYGPRGMPQAGIGPDATLVFDVELLGIE